MTYYDTVDNLTATTVTLEFDTVNTFNSTNLIIKQYSNIATGITVKTILDLFNNNWYWRVTAVNTSGTTVSNTYSITVGKILKRVLYQYENVGIKMPTWTNKRVLYQYENVISYIIEGVWLRARNIRIKRRM
jgi:hypothetical protein